MSGESPRARASEPAQDGKSSHSSPNTKRSHRSRSREHRDRRRDDRRRSRSRDRGSHRERDGHRDRRSRSRDRHRDHDRDRRRDRDDRDRDRERDRDERRDRDRRRKREDEGEDSPGDERAKRKREDANGSVDGESGQGTSRSDRRDRSRDSERRPDRPSRTPRDDDERRRREHGRDDRPKDNDRRRYDDKEREYRRRSPPRRRPSPSYAASQNAFVGEDEPSEQDSEQRSVFVSQLAARLTARDLGYFFEDKLGDGTVRDARIVTDRMSRRSKGIGYVEFRTIDLVDKALALSGTIVMGLPIKVQLTESERNRLHAGDLNLNLPPGVSAPAHGNMQLYIGSLHFSLTESDIKQVFEPFGELEFVDLHKDPLTGRSKGYAFIQYKRPEDAKMALEQMDGFEFAGRTLRVNTVHEKQSYAGGSTGGGGRIVDSLDEGGGGNLNAASRQALMQKLARIEPPPSRPTVTKPNIPQTMTTKCVILKNMFDPEEETERDWDKELAEDVKSECETKYGKVEVLKVEKESQGEIYVKFDSIEAATKAIEGLNGRWFGGKQVSAGFISDAMMQAHI